MTQNGVPRLRLPTAKAATTTGTTPESHTTTSPTTTKQRSAFVEGLKKTLRTPRLGRSRSERDVGATADVISGSLKNKKTTTKTKTEKKMKGAKTKKMKGATGAAAKTVSDPVKPRGLAKWNELLLEEKQRNKSMGDVLVLMKKDGAIERDEGSGDDEDDDPSDTTSDSCDGTGGGGNLSPLSPRHNPQALNCAQRKAMDDLRSAHPRAFER
ncbi:uncharacterized protein ACA1_224510 [Acanthamoeba castellanii str. Neff]|uniref:Uncharacterized protein n=1 Tax=Acanthamoeba castellanii (strain ATCC 30010 / Neff) TaxID=1257118 RepID=L8GT29_ACACF|nr:uncharacterized protein ACA1_224510 [Acanthamoeba castellanii str. Neff]ELR16072.1 hypothetical protein ACA1_224510 [Acanthamoeba castellanii str. Neff]